MNNIIIALSLLLASFIAGSAIAADKVVVVPLSTGRVAPASLPHAYGYVIGSTAPRFVTNYGATSVITNGTGDYTITLENDFSGYPVVLVSSYNNTPIDEIVTYSANDTEKNIINVRIADGSGAAIHSNFSFLVYSM
ncbi:MAG: hypothetical protein KJ804_11385 [Proteobacteria bacterium]|nr:hypothetical protein [Pseudomonadota bacterium]MBU1058909.1 hypothetical protein [Pseudomonadota bacterium]